MRFSPSFLLACSILFLASPSPASVSALFDSLQVLTRPFEGAPTAFSNNNPFQLNKNGFAQVNPNQDAVNIQNEFLRLQNPNFNPFAINEPVSEIDPLSFSERHQRNFHMGTDAEIESVDIPADSTKKVLTDEEKRLEKERLALLAAKKAANPYDVDEMNSSMNIHESMEDHLSIDQFDDEKASIDEAFNSDRKTISPRHHDKLLRAKRNNKKSIRISVNIRK